MEEGFISILKDLGEEIESSGSLTILEAGRKLVGATGDPLKDTGIAINYNEDLAKKMFQDPWHGATFSQKVWKNTNKLNFELNTAVKKGIMTGTPVAQMAMELSRMMETDLYKASRLVRTETMHHLNRVNLASMREDVEQVKEIVTLDERTSSQCREHHGKIHDIDEAPILPRHPNCRCVLVPYIDVDKVAEEFDKREKEILDKINEKGYNKNKVSGGISGAITRVNSDEAEKHAELRYIAIRKQKYDVYKIAQNTGYGKGQIQRIKNYLFVDEYELGDRTERFVPDFCIAQSWDRLTTGNIESHDLTLLKHEIMEQVLIENGLTQDEAHKIASAKYNYQKEAEEFYDKLKKRQKRKK